MKILNETEVAELKKLAFIEAEMINKSFNQSENFGLIMLSNTLTDFKQNYLNSKYGDILLPLCSEYRVFLINILDLIEKSYRSIALKELLNPSI
jgi:hypothetical protein